jgi:F-type H+-transporting ATPase subunit delta
MIGASRDSLSALRESLDARRAEPGFEAVSADLLAVADLLGREKSLRVQLADGGRPEGARGGLAEALLANRVAPLALAVVRDVVDSRWSNDADLVDALEQLGAQAAFTVAEADGELDRVEEELFRFNRAVDSSADLQMTLTDPSLPSAAKSGIVRDLLVGKASPVTAALLEYTVGHLHGRRVDAAVSSLSDLAARQRERVVAHVRVAAPLDEGQQRRLTDALTRVKGRQVRLDVVIDPAVLGGIAVQVGDEVIDGTIAARLEQARRALTD